MPDMSPVLSVKEAAEYLGVSAWTVYEYCRQGVIPHRRIGRRVLINREVLASWFRDSERARVRSTAQSTVCQEKPVGMMDAVDGVI